jgi:hypothetical protein
LECYVLFEIAVKIKDLQAWVMRYLDSIMN